MSNSDSNNLGTPPLIFNSDNRHVAHFYDDGNLLLNVRGKFFRVHKSILKMHSPTLRDLINKAQVKPSPFRLVETITLNEEPHMFAMLIDSMYEGLDFFSVATLQQCLELWRLADEYEMVKLKDALLRHLEGKLPISASDALHAPDRFRHYYDNPSLARLVISTESPKLLPWALYTIFTQINATIDPKDKGTYKVSAGVLGPEFTFFAYPMMLLPQIVARAFAQWNHQIDNFYMKGCLQVSTYATTERTGCSRSISRLNAQDPLYLSPNDRQLDAVKFMAPRIQELSAKILAGESPYDHWCVSCVNTLKSTLENIVFEIHPCLVECTTVHVTPPDLCCLQ